MKTKKRLILMAILILSVVTVMSLSSCSDSHEHSYSEWTIDEAPRVDSEGSMSRRCACGEVETYVLPAIDEAHYNIENISKSTCVTHGKARVTLRSDEVPFSMIYTRTLAEHKMVQKSNATEHWNECSVCGHIEGKEAHRFDSMTLQCECGVFDPKSNAKYLLFKTDDDMYYTVTGISAEVNTLSIPYTYNKKHVTTIGATAFASKMELVEVTMSPRIKDIGERGFYNCKKLEKVAMGDVENIGVEAFGYCKKLNTIVLPSTIKTISARAFKGCSALTSIILPTSITDIGVDAFDQCPELTIYVELATLPDRWDKECFGNTTKIYYYSKSAPSSSPSSGMGYWHYDAITSEPVIWQ